jgi:hypothetical protein
MQEATYPAMEQLALDELFTPRVLERLARDLRDQGDGLSWTESLRLYAQADLMDSFFVTWAGIKNLETKEVSR